MWNRGIPLKYGTTYTETFWWFRNYFSWAQFIATNRREWSPNMVVLYGITPKMPKPFRFRNYTYLPRLLCTSMWEHWAFAMYRGWNSTQLCVYICIGNVVNHCKDPWTNPYTWWNVISVFERVSFDLKYVSSFLVFISWKLTWHWKIAMFNRKYIFKWWIFHCHVSFRGGISWKCLAFNPSNPSYNLTFRFFLCMKIRRRWLCIKEPSNKVFGGIYRIYIYIYI